MTNIRGGQGDLTLSETRDERLLQPVAATQGDGEQTQTAEQL